MNLVVLEYEECLQEYEDDVQNDSDDTEWSLTAKCYLSVFYVLNEMKTILDHATCSESYNEQLSLIIQCKIDLKQFKLILNYTDLTIYFDKQTAK